MTTLARLEQEVARRSGPFFQAAQDSSTPTTSTTTAAYMPWLKTTAVLGGPENLWLLRRGILLDGSAPAPGTYSDEDRMRMVQTFDPDAGRIVVDRNWRNPMVPNELADFTHLHPAQELRPSVLAGLRRCFLEDTFAAVLTSQYGDIDLTYQQPWITNPSQVTDVNYGLYKPWATTPFKTYMQSGHVMLGSTSGAYSPSNVWVTAMRPASSFLDESIFDPAVGYQDDVELSVDLDYAASAAHIEAWHLFPSRMFAAAAGNLQASQEMVAREFTRQSLIWGPAPVRRMAFSEVVSLPLMGHATR